MKTFSHSHRQRGMAVINALVVVMAAALATTAILDRHAIMVRLLSREHDRVQAVWLLRGGLDWARAILQQDARQQATTRPDAIWAQPISGLEISTPDDPRRAWFSGRIEDEQGKFNLAGLVQEGHPQPHQQAALVRLLALLDLPAALAQTIGQRMLAAQASEDHAATQVPLRTLDDLAGLAGVTPDTLARLRPYVTLLPEHSRINVNTARAEVLSAMLEGLSLAEARALTLQRDSGLWFTNEADFHNRLTNPGIESAPFITTVSTWFRIAGEVTLDHAVASMAALLQRQEQGTTRIIWIEDMI